MRKFIKILIAITAMGLIVFGYRYYQHYKQSKLPVKGIVGEGLYAGTCLDFRPTPSGPPRLKARDPVTKEIKFFYYVCDAPDGWEVLEDPDRL